MDAPCLRTLNILPKCPLTAAALGARPLLSHFMRAPANESPARTECDGGQHQRRPPLTASGRPRRARADYATAPLQRDLRGLWLLRYLEIPRPCRLELRRF